MFSTSVTILLLTYDVRIQHCITLVGEQPEALLIKILSL